MLVGCANKDIDVRSNPYFSINVYRMTQEWKAMPATDIEIRKCKKEDLLGFLTEKSLRYYPNALCFANKKQLKLHNNWFEKEFNSFYIAIDTCEPSKFNNATH